MIVFVAFLFSWYTPALTQTNITLTTNQPLILYSNATINPNFILKNNKFDCSSFLYAYTQPSQQYALNSPLKLNITNTSAALDITISTLYEHFGPSLSQSTCDQTFCSIDVYQNCPNQLNSHNYFDIVQININKIGVFSYYLKCNRNFNPIFLQWGEFIITILATLTLFFASVFSKLSAFGNFAIEYSYRWIAIVFCTQLFFGLLTLFSPYVASILYDVLSWIIGTLGVAMIEIEILFKFVRVDLLKKETYIREIRIRVLDVVGVVVGFGMTLGWWFSSKNWIVSDIISLCMVISFIKAFKFVCFKVALISYIVMNIISVVGAVLTSLLHKQNFVVYFLLYVNNPFLLQMSIFTPSYSQNCVFISILSIFLPGLMVSYLRRFDRCRTTNIYLITTISTYFVGSLLWNLINIFSNTPIPFDLIVQGIMIIAFSLFAFKRKELRTIWEGTFFDQQFVHKVQIQMLNQRLSYEGPNSIKEDALTDSIGKKLFFNINQDQHFNEKSEESGYNAMKDRI